MLSQFSPDFYRVCLYCFTQFSFIAMSPNKTNLRIQRKPRVEDGRQWSRHTMNHTEEEGMPLSPGTHLFVPLPKDSSGKSEIMSKNFRKDCFMFVNCFFFVTLGVKRSSDSTDYLSGIPTHRMRETRLLAPFCFPSPYSFPPGGQGYMDS